jgi:hypothetical protein
MKYFLILLAIFFTINMNGQSNYVKDSISLQQAREDIKSLQMKFDLVKEKSDNHIQTMNFYLTVMGILLALGFSASVYLTTRNENRAKEVFEMYNIDKGNQDKKDDEIYNMFKSDKASQDNRVNELFTMFKQDRQNQDTRSNELYKMFLEDRKKNEQAEEIKTTETTIALVNRTLELAVQASERSARSLQIRLENILDSIETESIKLVENSGAFEDDKNLTLKREIQTEIHRIANKIEGLENNLVILDQEGIDKQKAIKLTPYATFIKGTDQYLKEQFSDALATWETLLRTELQCYETDKLKSLIYYWIGYLNNNLLKFKDGIINFANAEKLCEDSRKYELQRMQIETRFFSNESPEVISEDLEKLLNKVENDLSLSTTVKKNRTSKILNTLGNVYYSNYRTTNIEKLKLEYLKKSKKTFLDVLNLTDDSIIEQSIRDMDKAEKDKQKWVIFGLAESMYHIDEKNKEIAIKLFEKEVINLAEREYENREEKRTKVLAKTCQLICHYRINKEDADKLDNDRAMIELPLSDLNKQLTIYSQLVRKNVEYEEFKNHLKDIISKKV